jgi:phosphoglycolate phosphatase-like HAD superfamily hydrolase
VRRYRGVLLDVDGTLVDSNAAHAHAWEAAFARAGFDVGFARIRPLIGMGGAQLIEQLTSLPSSHRTHRAIARYRGEIFRAQWLPRIGPLLGARQLVLRLGHAQYRYAIASSAQAEELEPLLAIADIADLCELRTTASDVERAKPAPDVIEAALAKLGVERSQVVMIGDSPYDVAAARTARVDTIGVTTGGFTAEQLAGAVAVFDGPAGLLAAWDRSPLA